MWSGVGVCVALWSFGCRVERTFTSVGSWMGAHYQWRQKYRLDSCGPTTKPAWILVDTQTSERNKERRWWCDAGKPGTTIISESGWREAVTGSIFGCPFTLAPPSRRLDERPLIQRRGKKKWESKERYESQSCIPKCKKEAVNSREALYNSGWPEAWVVQGGLDAPPPLFHALV